MSANQQSQADKEANLEQVAGDIAQKMETNPQAVTSEVCRCRSLIYNIEILTSSPGCRPS